MVAQLRKRAVVVIAACVVLAGVARAQTVTPVPNLDLNRLRGTWYEIAKYPYKPTKQCLNNSFELIALGSAKRSVQIVDSCVTKRIYSDPTHNNAVQAKSGSGELKTKHLFLFHRTRDVIAIAPDDSWFVIGSANHKDLWIYSKTPRLADDVLQSVEAQAAAQGFAAAKLTMTKQNVIAAENQAKN